MTLRSGACSWTASCCRSDYVNDLTYLDEGTQFPLTLGEGELFLMGDNRNRSSDSRDERLGAVDERLIIGKAVLLVFPGRDSLTDRRDFSRPRFFEDEVRGETVMQLESLSWFPGHMTKTRRMVASRDRQHGRGVRDHRRAHPSREPQPRTSTI